jgi:glyoxylase-like metal-dependent hydrolase (beta-lactamase superfamily II)
MIFVTHGHEDHVEGVKALKEKTGAVVLAHRFSAGDFERRGIPLDLPLAGGDRFEIGGVPLRILYTPGHHPGAISILVADRWLFTGDTLFVGNCGRTDLAGSNAMNQFMTLQMLSGLPDDIIVLPGHDYGPTPTSTLGREKAENPTLRARTFEEFQAIP